MDADIFINLIIGWFAIAILIGPFFAPWFKRRLRS